MSESRETDREREPDLVTRLDLKQAIEDTAFLDVCRAAGTEGCRPKLCMDAKGEKLSLIVFDEAKLEQNAKLESEFTYFEVDVDAAPFPEAQKDNKCLRPLFMIRLESVRDHLRVTLVETDPTLRNKGIRTAFYKILTKQAQEHGFSYITGYQNKPELALSLFKAGRHGLAEINEELLPEFAYMQSDIDIYDIGNIAFLRPQDAETHVKPDRLAASPEDKLAYSIFRTWMKTMYILLGKLEKKEETSESTMFDLIACLEFPNNLLPPDKRFSLKDFGPKNPMTLVKTRVFLQFIAVNEGEVYVHWKEADAKKEMNTLNSIMNQLK